MNQSSNSLFLFRRGALIGFRWVIRQDAIKNLLSQCSGSIRDLVESLRHCDGFQLHQGRNLTLKRQFAEFPAQLPGLVFGGALGLPGQPDYESATALRLTLAGKPVALCQAFRAQVLALGGSQWREERCALEDIDRTGTITHSAVWN